MSALPLRPWCAAFLLLAGVTQARAAWRAEVPTEADSGVAIEISSPFEHSPPAGYMPMWVTIHNGSGAARVWTIACNGSGMISNSDSKQSSTESLRVESGQTGRVPVLMAVNPSGRGYYYNTYFVRIDGYAVADREMAVPGVNSTGKGGGTHAVGISDALATPIWTGLTKQFADAGKDLMGSPVDLGLLGGDWRALVGLEDLWLTDSDYNALDSTRRAAIRDWVSHGGRLFVCARTDDSSLRAAVGLPEVGEEADAGLGHVKILHWDGKPLELGMVQTATIADPSERAELGNSRAEWPMLNEIGRIPLNAPFLIIFIVLFALVVGPLNLFVFAKASRRHRLFWTTPAISVGASMLLAAFIILQDGFGGSGERVMFCLLMPDQKKAVVFQEQAARTGVLFARQFSTSEDLVLTPVQAEANGTARSYERTGRNYSGDWFASRSVQAVRAEAVIPSRAEIQLLNADAAHDGAPPVVTSSVPAAINSILYLDPAGRRWRGDDLRAGERITLRPEAESMLPEPAGGSATLDARVREVAQRRGSFYAMANDGPFFETLGSVRWGKQRAIFAGAVSGAR